MSLTYTPEIETGRSLVDFQLPGTDGKIHRAVDFKNAKGGLVMFLCNHCPYVKAIEARLIQLGHDYLPRGIQMVAISANDATTYPDDSFEKMKLKNYPFPYLYDESQEVAKAFGAVCTPDFFLYDSEMKLVYRGRLDDSWKDPTLVQKRELAHAIDAVLKGLAPDLEQKPSMGCNIKWKGMVRG